MLTTVGLMRTVELDMWPAFALLPIMTASSVSLASIQPVRTLKPHEWNDMTSSA